MGRQITILAIACYCSLGFMIAQIKNSFSGMMSSSDSNSNSELLNILQTKTIMEQLETQKKLILSMKEQLDDLQDKKIKEELRSKNGLSSMPVLADITTKKNNVSSSAVASTSSKKYATVSIDTPTTRTISSSVVASTHVMHEQDCANVFDRVRAGTLQDPNFVNQSMIETAVHETLTETDPKFHISVHNNKTDMVRWDIMKTGLYYERCITDHAKEVMDENPNGIVLDVGMNIGWFSLWAMALGKKVYSFEPNPINQLRFCESVQMNRFSNFNLYSVAVGDEEAIMTLTHPADNPGAAKLQQPKQAVVDSTTGSDGARVIDDVRVILLDDIAEQEGWLSDEDGPSISLLKVDVEGHDPQVLFGAKKLISSKRIQNIFIEYSCSLSEEINMKKAAKQLIEAGYKIHLIGNWNGAERDGAMEAVVTGRGSNSTTNIRGSLDSRLYSYCKAQSKSNPPVNQLNLWWKL